MRAVMGLLPVPLSVCMIRVGSRAHPTVTVIGEFIQGTITVSGEIIRNPDTQRVS